MDMPSVANNTETAGDNAKNVRTRQTNEKMRNLIPIEAAEQRSDGQNGVGDCMDGSRECTATQSVVGNARTTRNEAEHSPNALKTEQPYRSMEKGQHK